MTDVSTRMSIGVATFNLSHTVAILGAASSDAGGGITQGQADARYVRLAQVNATGGVLGMPTGGSPGDVVTKTSTGTAWKQPSIPYSSTNW